LTSANGGNLRVGYDGSSKGTLMVEGGTFNLGTNILYINQGATSSGGLGTVNLSGGTFTAGSLQFGGGGTFSSGTTAALNVTGGILYVGSGGISKNALGTLTTAITLSGGIIGATSNWTSPMPMTLASVNGNITFQAADFGNSAKEITLSGVLSGTGGLIKTGGGTLTLGGGNTYNGGTTINAGTLALTTTNNVPMTYTNNGGTLKVTIANPGSSLPAGGLTFVGGAQITFDLANLGNTVAPLISGGDLTMNGNVTINVSNAPASGTSVLFSYSGIRSGAGNFAAGSIPAGATLIDDVIGRKVSIAYPPATRPMIATISLGSSSMNFSGTNGTPLITYRILSATNLMNPTWITVLTNSFDNSGNFNATIPMDSANNSVFFRLVYP
jgi:rhamnogalacturonan endolyase